MARVFISYKRVDKAKVFKLKDKIQTAIGEDCWIDLEGIECDAMFKSVIIKAINESEIFLFMYSKAHSTIVDFDRDWTVREVSCAELKKNASYLLTSTVAHSPTSSFSTMPTSNKSMPPHRKPSTASSPTCRNG